MLVVVTFNNSSLLPRQQALFQKYAAAGHSLVVADNSTNVREQECIRKICTERQITYLRLPHTPYSGDGSKSHGFALNWVVRNYIKVVQPDMFGFLDHDIFPVESFDLRSSMGPQPFYGRKQDRKGSWYLWPGYCLFRTATVPIDRLDFMPASSAGVRLDTGGGNWSSFFKNFDQSRLQFARTKSVKVLDRDKPQESYVEHVDGWVHMLNGSYWTDAPPKEEVMWDYLNSHELKRLLD